MVPSCLNLGITSYDLDDLSNFVVSVIVHYPFYISLTLSVCNDHLIDQ